MPENDLEQSVADTFTVPTTPAGQSEDWEARFKGLQRSVAAKDGHATKLQARVIELEAAQRDDAARYEEQVTLLTAERNAKLTVAQQLETQVASLSATNAQLARDKDIRKLLLSPENKELKSLLPWYDADHLKPGDRQGDELIAYLKSFQSLLGNTVDESADELIVGASPPSLSTPHVNSTGMTEDQMRDWLQKNPRHKDYAAVEEAYFVAVSTKK